MKKILFLLAVICCVACSTNYNEPTSPESTNASTRSIQFILKGLNVDYATKSPKRVSSATITTEGMTDLWVFEGTKLLAHQISTDANFGNPTISLTIGAHDLTFIASKSDGQSFNNGIWSCTKVKDTFGTVLAYTVSKSSSSKQVQLTRLTSKIQYTIEDQCPQEIQTAKISYSGNLSLNSSLIGLNASPQVSNVNITSFRGYSNSALAFFTIPSSQSEASSFTTGIEILDTSGKSMCNYDSSFNIKANCSYNIHGNFFSESAQQVCSLNIDWNEQQDINLY